MVSKARKARRSARTSPESSLSPPPSGSTIATSASPALLQFQLDMIKAILAHPDDMMSVGRKAESLYFNLRPSDAPLPPPDFCTGKRWENSVDTLYKAAAAQPPDALTLNIEIRTLAEKFRELAKPPLDPLIGKREREEDDVGDAGGFEPGVVRDREERAFLEQMSGRAIPGSESSVPSAKRPRLAIPYVQFDDVRTTEPFKRFMARLRTNMKDYYDGKKELPRWDPPETWRASKTGTYRRFKDLINVPSVPFRLSGLALPDLSLLWLESSLELDPGIEERVKQVLDRKPIVHLLGPSGNGKSRILYQIARQTWNILLSCGHDAVQHPYGSSDILAILRLLNLRTHTTPGTDTAFDPYVVLNPSIRAAGTPSIDAVQEVHERWINNEHIAYHMFDLVILARLIVLDVFLGAWKPAILADVETPAPRQDPTPAAVTAEARAMHLWALLQICPTLLHGEDIFEATIRQLFYVHPDSLAREIEVITQRWYDHGFSIDKLLVDEVQTIASKWETAFGPDTLDAGQPDSGSKLPTLARALLAPFLRRLRYHFRRHSQLIVAGTKLSSSLVNAAVLHGTAKETATPVAWTEFGGQFSETALAQLFGKFFGVPAVLPVGGEAGDQFSLMENLSPSLRRDVYFWLPGRHRFPMVFISFVLALGPDSVARVLNTLVGKLTGVYPFRKVGVVEEMNLMPLIPTNPAERKKIRANTKLMANIVHIVATWLFNGKMPAVSDKDLELVRLGFGHLIPDAGISADNVPGNGLDSPLGDPNVKVSENLVAASLVGLLDDVDEDEPHSLLGYVDRQFSVFPIEPSAGGFAYEDLLIFCLCQVLTLKEGALLDSLFDFCYLPPSWRKQTARLIGVFSIDSGGTEPILVPHKLTTRLAWSTGSIEDTLHWFGLGKASSLRVPFLKPDHLMGADVVFALRLSGGHQIFVMLQAKCWSQKHGPAEVELAVWKLSPEGFYYMETKKEETKELYQKRAKAVRDAMHKLVGDTTLPMDNGQEITATSEKYAYKDETPKLPVLRVFAAFEDTLSAWPDMTPGALGRYPMARLAPRFMELASQIIPSLKCAADRAKALNRAA